MAKILLAAVFAVGLCVLSGCAESAERPALLAAAARNLRCPPTEMEAQLSRETAKVREYYVACDFVYTTVHCADGRCFTEDPVTLEWTLDDPQVDLKHVDH
jgi:hypothetical protein